MTTSDENSEKVHYICQTYVRKKAGRDSQVGLKIAKQFQYSTAAEAQNRAEREWQSGDFTGADAYMVAEDAASGEISPPSFLVRLGDVPDFEDS
ncbi:hypothetical protein [Boseongicola aestuarii]|uniref:Uncharacterized protein n=1 Tax=Boseongicola aestuarii TaxID=1470561 RepID=A0A238J5T4_9RHOB|nr:hypothetical protein [Boseongicola aestuarii]SMX25711.1 hypothetical protein BOA8489_03855 [Boseongicola aestuarii]